MSTLFWCEAIKEQDTLVHAPDCDPEQCYVVRGKKQEVNTGSTQKMPDRYRCTVTCAFCGRRKHYEDEFYHKQPLSANLKAEANGQGAQGNTNGNTNANSGCGKGKGNGKGKSKGDGSKAPAKQDVVADNEVLVVAKEGVVILPTTLRSLGQTAPLRHGGCPLETLAKRMQDQLQGPNPKPSNSK